MAGHTRFEKLVADAKKNITEISPQDAAAKLKSGEATIVDVREKMNATRNIFPARCI
jgi:hypothetical protein